MILKPRYKRDSVQPDVNGETGLGGLFNVISHGQKHIVYVPLVIEFSKPQKVAMKKWRVFSAVYVDAIRVCEGHHVPAGIKVDETGRCSYLSSQHRDLMFNYFKKIHSVKLCKTYVGIGGVVPRYLDFFGGCPDPFMQAQESLLQTERAFKVSLPVRSSFMHQVRKARIKTHLLSIK